MVEKLTELHDHVSVPCVREVSVRVVSLGYPPRVWKSSFEVPSPGFISSILTQEITILEKQKHKIVLAMSQLICPRVNK